MFLISLWECGPLQEPGWKHFTWNPFVQRQPSSKFLWEYFRILHLISLPRRYNFIKFVEYLCSSHGSTKIPMFWITFLESVWLIYSYNLTTSVNFNKFREDWLKINCLSWTMNCLDEETRDNKKPPAWSRTLLVKWNVSQLDKNFPAFYGTWRFITMFTRGHHLLDSWDRWI
jgi:hypothetical protein